LFSIEVVSAGSYTLVEGEFEMKNDIGFYVGPSPTEAQKQCALVFFKQSPKTIDVTSFGQCEEGFRAYPDGKYKKRNRNAN
jgi:hypothetical protein